MTVLLHQRIASVDYLVTFPPGVSPLPPDAIQAEFACPQAPAGNGIRVDLVAGQMPDLSAWRVLISAGPAWSIRQSGAQRCLAFGELTASPPTGLAACWQRDASRATVHCGPEYFAVRPDGVELGYSAGYPLDQLLLMYYLAHRQGLLVHAAGLIADGRALIFPGVSGAGKSTLAQQFLAEGWSRLLSDDRIIVRCLDGSWQAFGTPWPGDAGVAVNARAPLAAILFPARGLETRIGSLGPQAALERLLPATSMLWHEEELLSGQLETCERLLRDVPAFDFAWSPGTGVVDEVREFVRRL
jgi:hypothetical protein